MTDSEKKTIGPTELEQSRLNKINDRMIQLTDHLFDKGFEISKPLMWACAEWFIGIEAAIYEQGKMKGKAEVVSAKELVKEWKPVLDELRDK